MPANSTTAKRSSLLVMNSTPTVVPASCRHTATRSTTPNEKYNRVHKKTTAESYCLGIDIARKKQESTRQDARANKHRCDCRALANFTGKGFNQFLRKILAGPYSKSLQKCFQRKSFLGCTKRHLLNQRKHQPKTTHP